MRLDALRRRIAVAALIGGVWLTVALPVAAQAWQALPSDGRAMLEPLRSSWPSLPDAERERIADQASQWLRASDEERQQLRLRHQAWLDTPALRRLELRQRLSAWQALTPEQRESLQASASRFRDLPPEARERLRASFAALPPAERRAFLLPPSQRDAATLAQHLFPYVAEVEREATLGLLVELGPEGRAALEQRSRRLSPAAREALRLELLGLPREERLQRLR